MAIRVTDLTVEEFKSMIEIAVEEKLRELLGDPDEGLSLRPEIAEQLRRSLAATESGQRGVPADEVARRLGLE
jgi:hypothetical protein